MWQRLNLDSGNRIASSMTPRRRRHLAAWLLVGWVAFWLVAAIQPCCQNPAVDDASQWAAVALPGHPGKTETPCGSAPRDDQFCQGISIGKAGPFDTAGAVPDRAEPLSGIGLASIVPAPAPDGALIANTRTDFLPFGAPLYLRHQRLLI